MKISRREFQVWEDGTIQELKQWKDNCERRNTNLPIETVKTSAQ